MKEITAIGQPFVLLTMLEHLKRVAEPLNVTLCEILDLGGLTPEGAGQSAGEGVKKWRLEVVVHDTAYDSVLETISEYARSDSAAPIIFIAEVENISRHDASSQSGPQRVELHELGGRKGD